MPGRMYTRPEADNIGFTVKYHQDPAVLTDVCLFSSYSFSGIVEEYVYYYLEQLQKAGFSTAFISTSALNDACISRLSKFTFLIIERENKCPDFGSWKAGLSLLDWGIHFNSILLVNDSVFGPFFNLGDIVTSMKDKFDVWGMTESNEIAHHIQSYFIYFNKRALAHPIFSNFWQQVDLSATKDEVIHRYEVGMSVLFRNNNFKIGAYARIDELTRHIYSGHRITNPTLVFWKVLIQKHQFPFLKRELLIKLNISKTYWSTNLYVNTSGWKKTIETFTDYPVSFIEQFQHNYYNRIKAGDHILLQKRKILFLVHNAEENDGQILLITFLRWLKNETDIKAEIVVCNTGRADLENEYAGLGVVTNFYDLSNIAKRNLKERLIDEIALIVCNTVTDLAIQKFFSYTFVPQVIFIHEPLATLKDYLSADNISWLEKNIAHFITSNSAARQLLTDNLAGVQEKIDLVYKFVNNDSNDTSAKTKKEIKAALGIPADAFVVGMSGDAAAETGAGLLPIIAAELCKEDNNIYITWLSHSANTAGYDQVYADLRRAGLTERVHLVKKGIESARCVTAFDIFIMAAREDSFPLLNLQVALAGKPVICFEGAELIKEYAGIGAVQTVPYLDIKALSEKVINYYNNPQQLAVTSANMLAVVKQHFTTHVQAPRILQIFRKYYDDEELSLKEESSLTFLTHIYYENSWDEIRNKLKNFDNGRNNFLFSISEACLVGDKIIEDIKKSFKNVYYLVTSNIGKDIGGKMALIDLYLLLDIKSKYVVFLHDKQSPHSVTGETWKNGLFKIIDPNNQKHISALFRDPAVGIVGDKDHIINEYDQNTGRFRNNSQFSKKLLQQFEMSIENYDFLGGSMYWIRSSIIEKFFEKNHPILMRENLEAGNVLDLHEERMAHTWERMFSWIATSEGFIIKGI